MTTAIIENTTIKLIQTDITTLAVDAIVNAANARLAGGGGVDGAIHRAGGPAIMAETRKRYPDGCPTGKAVITGGGNLPAGHVIHTVGPIWRGGSRGEDGLLANAYRNSLTLAMEHTLKTIAFPSISTGVYRFPVDRAAGIALPTATDFIRAHPDAFTELIWALFDEQTMAAYRPALERLPA